MIRGAVAAALVWGASSALAQPVIGAKAGVVSYAIGKVYLDNQAVQINATHFPEVKQNVVLRTEGGRAEVLLGPCAVLRVDEDSSFRMLADDLTRPHMELLSGSAVVDIAGIRKGTQVTLQMAAITVQMARKGLYRLDFSPALLKVFEGRATTNGKLGVSAGRMLAFDGSAAEKFDPREGDGLDLWSHQRSLILARARASERKGADALALAAAASRAAEIDAAGQRGPNDRPWTLGPHPGTWGRGYAPDSGCHL